MEFEWKTLETDERTKVKDVIRFTLSTLLKCAANEEVVERFCEMYFGEMGQ